MLPTRAGFWWSILLGAQGDTAWGNVNIGSQFVPSEACGRKLVLFQFGNPTYKTFAPFCTASASCWAPSPLLPAVGDSVHAARTWDQ